VGTAAEQEAYRQRLDVFLASRDVGKALTREALLRGIRLEAVIDAAADVAAYADDGLAIVNNEYAPRLECREGCSFCCCKPGVLATIPEFLRILDRVRTTFDDDARRALIARAQRYASQLEGRHYDDLVDESVPCPLLVDDRCSVYDARPLVCRGYNSTSVEACRKAHADRDALVPIFAVLKDVTDGATVGVAQSLEAVGVNDALVDLGTALNLALAAGDELARTVIEGGEGLRPAENSSWVKEMWTLVRHSARQVGVQVPE
jgi:Fe-S-cluster containining protein